MRWLILAFLLASCSTMVSGDLMPYMSYREDPVIQIIEYSDKNKLQRDCYNVCRMDRVIYKGCAKVPHDPEKVCVVRVMQDDPKTLRHEVQHCHGYADTYLPWKKL